MIPRFNNEHAHKITLFQTVKITSATMNNSATIPSSSGPGSSGQRPSGTLHLILGACLVVIFAYAQPLGGLTDVIIAAIADAYIQVTTFVAATLFLFYGLERWFKFDLTHVMAKSGHWQIPVAALLGALPGCGGAIMVMTRYTSGHLSFGAVLATLTATMGDAAFLLLAKEPLTGLAVMVTGLVVGTISGYLVDFLHGPDFLRSEAKKGQSVNNTQRLFANPTIDRIWLILFIPGIVIGVLAAFQIDLDSVFATAQFEEPVTFFGFLGGVLCLFMWILPRFLKMTEVQDQSILRRTISDTNFVTSWVILAFLIFEVGIYLFDFNLSELFSGVAIFTPMIGILLGFLPGCGPQVIVTSLYLTGVIPLSAQLGNAISNDGDALFPAIALAPRTAILATLYSAIPAFIIAYGWYFLFEV